VPWYGPGTACDGSFRRDVREENHLPRLRVGLVAPPWVPVPPPLYGGTELVIDTLARGLVAAGHEVVLFATGDSTCPVPLLWAYPEALGTTGSAEAELDHVIRAYGALDGRVDVIHDHTLFGPWRAAARPGLTPVVTTNHGPFNEEMASRYSQIASRVPVVAISAAQAATAPEVGVAAVIHHGIDVDALPFGTGQGGYVAFLGRMNPDKGPDRAIRAARAAGVPIRLGAKMWEPAELAYFANSVEPLLGDDAVYVGEVGRADKTDLLAGAAALLNPIRWPEPFGLVMVEALAVGTPVIAFCEGAAPEIVRHGVNGFLCADEQAMAGAIACIGQIDRRACRAVAEEAFSTRRMVADHLVLYRDAIASWQPRGRAERHSYKRASRQIEGSLRADR